jgi:MYXO-CTERM domain-containing protein
MSHSAPRALVATLAASVAWVASPSIAAACGCFSPPVPMPGAVDFAVNQQAEQIIFEVEPDGHIVAHVLIRYAGDPAQFAWLVPVPSVPELELSFADAFGLIDAQTEPSVTVVDQNICPQALYNCRQHPMPSCPGQGFAQGSGGGSGTFAASAGMGAGAGGAGGAGSFDAPGVTVFARQQVGAYDTIVFGAGDAQGAVDWLQTEGFIVNETSAPYMQPYLDENMLFVAAKLVPGADADEIRPLRMRYEGDEPMIPLQLTAVATEPNLTVTAYIYGADAYRPQDQTLLDVEDIPEGALGGTLTASGYRDNYPMVLARLFDEEGGRAFMLEYASSPPRFQPTPIPAGSFGVAASDCCAAAELGQDVCNVIGDGECQCPLDASDAPDCEAKVELVGGVLLVEELARKYPRMTRITTRLSAEEMTFDPMFEIDGTRPTTERISAVVRRSSLLGCESDVIDDAGLAELDSVQGCSTVYCGRGRCAATAIGVGCACDLGHVARTYTDLDGSLSVTCVRDEAPVDLAAGGLVIPDICGTLTSSAETECVNLAGFAGMRCADGSAAVLTASGVAPSCAAVTHDSATSGAADYSAGYLDVEICAPRPPICDARFGWLEANTAMQRESVQACESSMADPSWLDVPPEPTCEMIEDILDDKPPTGGGGTGGGAGVFVPSDTSQPRPAMSKRKSSGCSVARGGSPASLALFALALLGLARRRRSRTTPLAALAIGLAPFASGCPAERAELDSDSVEDCLERAGVACTYLGTGELGFNGDGRPLRESMVYWPVDITFTGGRGYVLDWNNHRVREITGDGELETVIGTDFIGDGPDDRSDLTEEGALGTDVHLNHPTQLLPQDDGTLLLIAWHNHKLRRFDPESKRVWVVAGGPPGFGGDGGPLAKAKLNQPVQAARLADGSFVIVDQRNQVIRRVDADGMIHTIAGKPAMAGFGGDGGPPLEALFNQPAGPNPPPGGGIAVHDDGRIFVADTLNHRIRVIDLEADSIDTLAGTGEPGFAGDGGPARDAQLNNPRKLTLGPDGRLYVGDQENNRIRAIDLEREEIDTVAGNGESEPNGDGLAPEDTALDRPAGVSFDQDGAMYILDTFNARVLRVFGFGAEES